MQPTPSSNLLTLAVAHHQAGRLMEAEAAYQRVLAAEPANADAMNLMGALAGQQGRHQAGEQWIRRAIAVRPGVAEYSVNLGIVQAQQRKLADAVASFREAARLRADLPLVWFHLAKALQQSDLIDDAIDAYRRGLALKPDEADAHVALAVLLSDRLSPRDAAASLEAALRVKPDHAEAHWRLMHVRLLLGEYESAWSHAGWDAKVPFLPRGPSFQRPEWDGSDLQGKTILLHTTQGVGDAIQFIRYLPMVVERAGRAGRAERAERVVLLCHQPKLLPLLKGITGVGRVITEAWELAKYDVHCSLMTLPRLFGTTVSSIPWNGPYVTTDAALSAKWAERLSATQGSRVGIVWAGNPDHRNDRNRSMPLAALSPLANAPGITLYSLQKGAAAAQLQTSPMRPTVIDLGPELNDFADTAAVIANLDLVITVDTSVAHLAGAMGKGVWMLLPFVPDWRWMLDRSDSPWYPTMRLFRQRAPGNWDGVTNDVLLELPTIIRSSSSAT